MTPNTTSASVAGKSPKPMRRLAILLAILLPLRLMAQAPVDSAYMAGIERLIDSLERQQKMDAQVREYEVKMLRDEMRLGREMYVPLIRGLVLTATNKGFNDRAPLIPASGSNAVDYVPALTPLAATYALKAVGIEGRSTTRRLLAATAFSLALEVGVVQTLKQTTQERRPDGSSNHSFPSGHAAVAYLSATILHREYGHLSPWISVGGYSTATLSEWLRLRHHRHYVSDILIGSGIGVASANLGYFLADRMFGIGGINRPRFTYGDLHTYQQFLAGPRSVSLLTGTEFGGRTIEQDELDVLMDDFDGHIRLKTSTTYSAGVECSYAFNKHWATDIALRLSTSLVKPDINGTSNFLSTDLQGTDLQQWHLNIAAKYSAVVQPATRASLRLLLGDRFTQRMTLRGASDGQVALQLPAQHAFEVGSGLGCDLFDGHKYIVGFTFDYLHAFSSLLPNRYTFNTYWRVYL